VNKWSRRLVIAVHQTIRQPGERSAHLSPIVSLQETVFLTDLKLPLWKRKSPRHFAKLRKCLEGEQWISADICEP
jgi:hypothetical protein